MVTPSHTAWRSFSYRYLWYLSCTGPKRRIIDSLAYNVTVWHTLLCIDVSFRGRSLLVLLKPYPDIYDSIWHDQDEEGYYSSNHRRRNQSHLLQSLHCVRALRFLSRNQFWKDCYDVNFVEIFQGYCFCQTYHLQGHSKEWVVNEVVEIVVPSQNLLEL